MLFIGQPDQFQQRIDGGRNFRRRFSGKFQRKRHVSKDGSGGKQIEMLKNHADFFAGFPKLPFRHGTQFFAIDDDRTVRRPFQHIDAADQGAFSGAAFADDAEYFPFPDVGADASQGFQRTGFALIGFMDRLELYHKILLLSHKNKRLFTDERGVAFKTSRSSSAGMIPCRNWHRFAFCDGCRGIIGPVPPPTLDEKHFRVLFCCNVC